VGGGVDAEVDDEWQVQHMQQARVRLQRMRLCNECETGGNECARCNECGQGVQRMRMAGATNADRGATDADGNECSKWGATNARTGATNADGNECSKRGATNARTGATNARTGATDAATNAMTGATNATYGATNAQSGVRELCLGARRAGDSNTKWRRQGVLSGAHNLLENGGAAGKPAQKSVLKE